MDLHTLLHTVIAYDVTYVNTCVIACAITYAIAYVIAYVVAYVTAYVITCVIAYPYARTVNFETRLEVQLRTYQPPIPKASRASAWCHKYIGRWMRKTEISPTGLGENFGRLNG